MSLPFPVNTEHGVRRRRVGGVKLMAGGGGHVNATPLQEGRVCVCVCLGINLEGRGRRCVCE